MIKSELVNLINEYGDVVVGRDDAINYLLEGNDIDGIMVDDEDEVTHYERMTDLIDSDMPSINSVPEYKYEPSKYLKRLSQQWLIPSEYVYMDIITYLVKKCTNDVEKQRVANELVEFEKRNELDILKVMVYIVDAFRKNGIIWGVGRGSSVSCFCLYLIGINKINPLEYDISYTEFFKE